MAWWCHEGTFCLLGKWHSACHIAGALKRAELSAHTQQRHRAHLGGIYLCPHLGKGNYLVSGGLAEGAVCCQVFRIPHAGLVASLLEQRKKNTNVRMHAGLGDLYTQGQSVGDLLEIDLEMAWLPTVLLL